MKPALCYSKEDIIHNVNKLKEATTAQLMAVVKCDGYGLGISNLARILVEEGGINRFGVSRAEEAFALRDAGFIGEILLLEPFSLDELPRLLHENVTLSIVSLVQGKLATEVALQETGLPPRCHLRLDTGHGVYGFLPSQLETPETLEAFSRLAIAGVYTHFSLNSGNPEKSVSQQNALFSKGLTKLKEAGIETGIVHAAASSTFFMNSTYHYDMVRIGSAILGRVHSKGGSALKKVGVFRAPIIEVRELPAGWTIGYSGTYKVKKPMRVGIVALGGYDGLCAGKERDAFRPIDILRYIKGDISLLKGFHPAYVNGKKTRILGIISLCNSVIDLTRTEAQLGDIVEMPANPLRVNPDVQREQKLL
jgi:alanine racemase